MTLYVCLTSSVTSILLKLDQWKLMRERKFIPTPAKSVQHEPRNGIILCPNHHALFDAYCFYIRWVLQVSRNVKIIPFAFLPF